MAGAPIPADVKKFMRDYAVSEDEVWLVAGGRSYAVKHSAIERIAAEKGIKFDVPQVIEARGCEGIATVIVTGRIGDLVEWSFGEASPKNNKNAYPFAMAEKRGKDRVTLKLLKAHGIYSEEEADDFKAAQSQQREAVNDVSAYVAHCKTGILNHTDAGELRAYWRQEQEARDVLRLKPGVPEYDDLYGTLVSHGKAISQPMKAAAE